MTIMLLLASLAGAALLAYFAARYKAEAGAWLTLLASMFALAVLWMGGDTLASGQAWGLMSFRMNPLGWFFSLVLVAIYGAGAFGHLKPQKVLSQPASFYFLYLLSLMATLGVFTSAHWLALFIFWEVSVWSTSFLIGYGKKGSGAVTYFGMSLLGSFLMLFAILIMAVSYQSFSVDGALLAAGQGGGPALLVLLLMLVAAMIKLGLVPFHHWMPEAYDQSPRIFAPVLAGGLAKMGAFMAMMVTTLLPMESLFAGLGRWQGMALPTYGFLVLAALTVVVGTLMAIKQEDAKRLLAYSSVANSGYIMMGLLMGGPMSTSGALIHVLAHALATSVAFMVLAAVSAQTGTTRMDQMGGLIHRMPKSFVVFLVAILSLVGLPPTMGFISKWLILQSLASRGLFFIAAAAIFGSIGSLLYAFRILSAVFLGQLKPEHQKVTESSWTFLVPTSLLALASIYFGGNPYGLVDYTAKIQASLGMEETIQTSLQGILGSNGHLNARLILGAFAIGLAIAAGVFLLAPKSKKVGLMDTYTAGEFIYSPELYHYGTDFFAPLSRIYEKHPQISKLYETLASRVRDIGTFIKYLVFSPLPSRTAVLITVFTILLMWGERL